MAKSKWASQIKIPKAYPHLCTKTVLVMELLNGKRLVDGVKEQYEALAKKVLG